MAETSNSEELVLAFLAEAGDEFVSGEAISGKLGLTRAAVWKHVNALRAAGYRIEALPARGYRLAEVPDRLTALELRPLLNTHDVGRELHCYEELGSTNDRAKDLAEEGAEHGEIVVAEAQTAGRGRRGREWVSPARKNLYFSVVLRPELPPSRAAELTLVASIAVCDAARHAGVEAGIKWPNDLLASGKKLGESSPSSPPSWIGCMGGGRRRGERERRTGGLRGAPREATSLLIERGALVPRALFAAACFTALEEWLDRHAEEGFGVIRNAWRERSVTLGREVSVKSEGREIVGVAEDIDDHGALLVRGRAGWSGSSRATSPCSPAIAAGRKGAARVDPHGMRTLRFRRAARDRRRKHQHRARALRGQSPPSTGGWRRATPGRRRVRHPGSPAVRRRRDRYAAAVTAVVISSVVPPLAFTLEQMSLRLQEAALHRARA